MKDKKNSKQEELLELQKKINKLIETEKRLSRNIKSRERSDYRRKRARRLIETGALIEKYFDIDESISIEEREEIFKMFSEFVKKNKPERLRNKKPNLK
jgi:urocanate hydratase